MRVVRPGRGLKVSRVFFTATVFLSSRPICRPAKRRGQGQRARQSRASRPLRAARSAIEERVSRSSGADRWAPPGRQASHATDASHPSWGSNYGGTTGECPSARPRRAPAMAEIREIPLRPRFRGHGEIASLGFDTPHGRQGGAPVIPEPASKDAQCTLR